ncbi:MAG: hypothetical protein M3Z04_01710, partial [Chloroflexota bacterium]|nr:hypothetical protein [Chloroflexota bacterium]
MPDPDATFAALRAALAVDPQNLPLRLHLAALLREAGRAADAEAEYRLAQTQIQARITERPADAALYNQLADVQQALGDEWGAQSSLGIALALGVLPGGGADLSPNPSPTKG